MKRRFNFLKALLPFILAIGTFSACNQDSPKSPENVKVIIKNWPENVTTINFAGVEVTKTILISKKKAVIGLEKVVDLIYLIKVTTHQKKDFMEQSKIMKTTTSKFL